MPYLRGYKIKLFLIAADFPRIEKVYRENDALCIASDCSFKVAFAPNDYKTADYLSRICLDESLRQTINLPSDSQIILMDKGRPIISKKVFYYKDAEMKKKIMAPVSI